MINNNMKYLEKIKQLFFTEKDLGISYPDDTNKELALQSKIIAAGAQSQILMSNPIFQNAVADMYLTLEAQLDSVEDTDLDAEGQIRWIRVQRRALRQICAILDNKIAMMESVEKSNKEIQDES